VNPYEIIKRPLLTEKSTEMKEKNNQYCFEVDSKATKSDVRNAVQDLFNVRVVDVKTMQYMGKTKRLGRFVGRRRDWKKAVVTLKAGASIELFEGV
jgi:large subunit ribosomal protein L23